MGFYKRITNCLKQHVTVLFIPHTNLPVLRGQFSVSFLLFGLMLWTGLTVWSGYLAGRHVDYWITSADNAVMLARMNYLSREIEKSRAILEIVKTTDRQMRALLGLRTRQDILESSQDAAGGPSATDRLDLRSLLANQRAQPEPIIHHAFRDIRQESARRLASFSEIHWYISNERNLLKATPDIWPTSGHITSSYGYRFSPMGEGADSPLRYFHEGVDIADLPDTPIVSTADGVVHLAGWSRGFGMMVLIDHGFGYSTLYGHTSQVMVKTGERVKRHQLIAFMGTTGRSTGHHLHYEVWHNGKPVNPMRYLTVRPEKVP